MSILSEYYEETVVYPLEFENKTLKKENGRLKEMLCNSYVANQNYADTIMGIKCLITDLAMYRDDINNCSGRSQRIVDELIKELDCQGGTICIN